jgi:ABC-type xylose transport system permease subunit
MLNKSLTKRQLGILAIMGGIVALASLLVYDRLGMSDPDAGFGPSQQVAVLAAILIIGLGISLIPLGDEPA